MRKNLNEQLHKADRVCEIVCTFFALSPEQVKSKSRKHNLTFVRFMLCFLLVDRIGMARKDVGMFLGGRDHSTVINGINVFWEILNTEPKKKKQYDFILKLLPVETA